MFSAYVAILGCFCRAVLIQNCGKPLFPERRPGAFVLLTGQLHGFRAVEQSGLGREQWAAKDLHTVLSLHQYEPVWQDLWTQQSVPEDTQY